MKNTLKILLKIIKFKLTAVTFVLLAGAVFVLVSSRTEVAGIKSYVVQTGSMQPTLPVGSVIFTQAKGTYNVGDIVTFLEGDRRITHRIVGVENEKFVTKGDANNSNDAEHVSRGDIVGSTVFHLPYIGNVVNQMKTPQGFLIFVVLPGALFIFMELWSIKNEIVKSTEKRIREQLKRDSMSLSS